MWQYSLNFIFCTILYDLSNSLAFSNLIEFLFIFVFWFLYHGIIAFFQTSKSQQSLHFIWFHGRNEFILLQNKYECFKSCSSTSLLDSLLMKWGQRFSFLSMLIFKVYRQHSSKHTYTLRLIWTNRASDKKIVSIFLSKINAVRLLVKYKPLYMYWKVEVTFIMLSNYEKLIYFFCLSDLLLKK